MKNFHLKRIQDESGVSGTGWVAEGVQFANGKCVVNWLTRHTSTTVFDSIETVKQIHGHNGKTIVVFDGEHNKGPDCIGCKHPIDAHFLDNCGGCSVGACQCVLMGNEEFIPKKKNKKNKKSRKAVRRGS